ncbi:MAG: FAD-binding oxidoreductase, partial [Thiohalobacterales bacterium]|nr:FAD-binding oxidoreductase [Thiohalobacterales bacterium]
IGGNLSTNAGGMNVLRYGNARQLVLGLEVVLPDGTIWNGLDRLLKNNTGYDLKQLFLGSEGTLGIITAAVLRLFPEPVQTRSIWMGIGGPEQAVDLLALAKSISSDQVSRFELIPNICLQVSQKHFPGIRYPLPDPHPWHVLIQFSASSHLIPLAEISEQFTRLGMDNDLVLDGIIAQSAEQERQLWHIREVMVPAQKKEGLSIKHDISVPVSRIPDLVKRGCQAAEQIMPGIRPYPFGHIGDGNLHFNMLQPSGMSEEDFYRQRPSVQRAVYDIVADLGGSFSAEHGIGRIKTEYMRRYKSPLDLDLMRRIKQALDQDSRLNPGKVLP